MPEQINISKKLVGLKWNNFLLDDSEKFNSSKIFFTNFIFVRYLIP